MYFHFQPACHLRDRYPLFQPPNGTRVNLIAMHKSGILMLAPEKHFSSQGMSCAR